ncbi:MmyB family transcriptional regulator [Streptomyces sp. NPDC055722]
MKDPDFRRWWSDHKVRSQRQGRKEFVHPVAGELSLDFQMLDVRGATEQSLLVYTAEPHSPSAQALTFLAGWAATELHARPAEAAGSPRRSEAASSTGEPADEAKRRG